MCVVFIVVVTFIKLYSAEVRTINNRKKEKKEKGKNYQQ